MAKYRFSSKTLEEFRTAYQAAVENGKLTFEYHRRVFRIHHTKNLIEYLDWKLNGKPLTPDDGEEIPKNSNAKGK